MSDYDSDDDYDEYLFDNDNLFEPEEESLTRYNIILCELYNSKIHGFVEKNKEQNIGYLVCCRFKNLDTELIEDIASELRDAYFIRNNNSNHTIYKNYRNIISRPDYFKPEIAQCVYLESLHCVAILKTFWIRIIQRKWKKICAERNRVLKERCSLKSIKFREINGKWPISCIYFPTLKGMLC
jgi:hypothetical protein